MIPRIEPFISTCSLWGGRNSNKTKNSKKNVMKTFFSLSTLVWGQCFFGFYLFISLCLFRYYRMYRVIIQGKKFWEYQLLVIMVFMIPALIVCVIIEALKLSQFDDDPTYMSCYINYYAQIGLIVIFVIYVVPLIVTPYSFF